MYEALGNAQTQAEIRADNPDVLHCLDLQVSANACDGCPKNPIRSQTPESVKKDREVLEENIPCLEHIKALSDYVAMGLITGLKELTPDEAFALRITFNQMRARERASMADIMMTSANMGIMGKQKFRA